MATMRVMRVPEPGAPLELAEREVPEPGPGEVRVRVQACGICHSDAMVKDGHFPGVPFPIVPGHEVAGVLDALGGDVHGWEIGERVGVGWFGGNCGDCERCRRADLMFCENMPIPGVTTDGGYADYLVCRAGALARMPADLDPAEAAPLMCAGITTFHAIRTAAPPAGSLLAVLGLGGLGHLGVQYAARLGFETVAIARGEEKRDLALKLGAHDYIDSTAEDVGAALTALGGAALILATVTSGAAMSAALGGLALHGKFVVVGASPDAMEVPPLLLIGGNKSIQGHASGIATDSEDTLAFSALHSVRPMIETMPLERAEEAVQKMVKGEARFRMVLLTGQ